MNRTCATHSKLSYPILRQSSTRAQDPSRAPSSVCRSPIKTINHLKATPDKRHVLQCSARCGWAHTYIHIAIVGNPHMARMALGRPIPLPFRRPTPHWSLSVTRGKDAHNPSIRQATVLFSHWEHCGTAGWATLKLVRNTSFAAGFVVRLREHECIEISHT